MKKDKNDILDSVAEIQNSEDIVQDGENLVAGTKKKGKGLRLDYPQTIKVGLAFAIIMVFWTAYDFVVPLLLEKAYGLSNMTRGLIMGLDNLLSLFMLPLFGKLSDKSNGKLTQKYGRRTPYIVIGTLIAVLLMIFVPISSQKQLERSEIIRADITAQLNDDTFMNETLNMFWGENGDTKYCDKLVIANNKISKESFVAMRHDSRLEVKSGFLGIGGKTYFYDLNNDGKIDTASEKVELSTIIDSATGKTVENVANGNADYKKYVASGMNTFISEKVEESAFASKAGITSISIYMVVLLFVLLAMATFRSPAVALMPDVTPKPLRSQANAMINLMGGVGGAIAFLIYTVVLFQNSLKNYIIIFGAVAGAMLLLLILFLCLVKEKKLVKKCNDICEEYGITDEDEEKADIENLEQSIETLNAEKEELIVDSEIPQKKKHLSIAERMEARFNAKYAHLSFEEKRLKVEKSKKISLILMLASIFMWFMGWNAVSSNLSIYIVKELNLSAGIASIVSGVSMAFSAIAFIPVGYMAAKLGRRKTILIGFGIATASLLLIFLPIISSVSVDAGKAALFALFYMVGFFGLVIINVNTLPMVLEISKASDVGKFTGVYYMATMSAQAIAPFIAGAIMDAGGNKFLFLWSAICVFIALILMIFVRYGDGMKIPKGKKMSKEEHKQLMLDSMDSPD